jgi:hypothetical protein
MRQRALSYAQLDSAVYLTLPPNFAVHGKIRLIIETGFMYKESPLEEIRNL